MKWTVNIEPENEQDQDVLRLASVAIQMRGLSSCIIGLANKLKGEDSDKYTDEPTAIVMVALLSASLKAESDKR